MLAAHDADTINSHKAQKKTQKAGQPGLLRPARHISRLTPHPCASAERGRPFRGERDPRVRKGQATEPFSTKNCRVVKSEAGGRFTRHTRVGVPVRRAAISGDRGTTNGDVSRLWCCGRQHATCVFVSPRRRAGNPTSAVGPRDLSLPEEDVRPPTSGKRCGIQRRQELTHGHRYREERPPKRVGTGFLTQKHSHRRHLRGPPSGDSPARRKC